MLKNAHSYKDILISLHRETWYDPRYTYYYCDVGCYDLSFEENNYSKHQFASVDKYGNVIGYISYGIDWAALSADNFNIINYDLGNVEFIKDCYRAVYDIFETYKLNRIEWFCIADNPAINGYRKFIKKYGGKECGYFRQFLKLLDGKIHDGVHFEILKEEFKAPEYFSR